MAIEHRTKLDKTDPSRYMEFGNSIDLQDGRIHDSDSTGINAIIKTVVPIGSTGIKYSITIIGDYLNVPEYNSKVIQNGTEGIIYYSTSNLNNIRPFVLYRISSTPTTDNTDTTFDILIIDNQKEIIEIFGETAKLGIPHIDDTCSWPLQLQNLYNNNTVINKISVSSNGSNSIKFKWEDYSNASVWYKIIYRKFSININTVNVWIETDLIPSVSGINQEYVISNLIINQRYEWSVMSYYSEDLKQFSIYYNPPANFVFN